jgi:hypothetical protein
MVGGSFISITDTSFKTRTAVGPSFSSSSPPLHSTHFRAESLAVHVDSDSVMTGKEQEKFRKNVVSFVQGGSGSGIPWARLRGEAWVVEMLAGSVRGAKANRGVGKRDDEGYMRSVSALAAIGIYFPRVYILNVFNGVA